MAHVLNMYLKEFLSKGESTTPGVEIGDGVEGFCPQEPVIITIFNSTLKSLAKTKRIYFRQFGLSKYWCINW